MTAFASLGFGDGFGEGQLPWVDRSFAQKATAVSFGSGPANQSAELVARNLPVELGCHRADVRLDRVPTQEGVGGGFQGQ
jgi:hypothetical protein